MSTVKVTELKRVFRVNGKDLPDPAPASSPERALELLSLADPALNNAVVETPKSEGSTLVYPVKVNLGNKGFTEVRLLFAIILLLVTYGAGLSLLAQRRLAAEQAAEQARLLESDR